MTQLIIHCPFCCNNIDLYCDIYPALETISIGNATVINCTCEHCQTHFTLICSEVYQKAHRGDCLKYPEPCDRKGNG